MLYTIPDYYKEFRCTADKCEDTCCAGWQIVIDEKSLVNYRKICRKLLVSIVKESDKNSFSKLWKMFTLVNWSEGTFRQDMEKRCAFLNEHNLCDLYIAHGEKSLCKTCKQYPRHVEEFEGVREITLSISCPEVARILMERKTPVTFLSQEKEGEEEYEDFDPFLFSILEDARKEMLIILQNRNLSIRERTLLVLAMAHDMQVRINRQDMFACFQVIEKYCGDKALRFIQKYLQKKETEKQRVSLAKEMFEKLYELELLREEWNVLLQETEALLYVNEKVSYEEIQKEFAKWESENSDIEIHLEQLLVYFLFIYFPGAVYDGEVYAKAQMVVYCVWMIHEFWMARWLKNEKNLELEEMTELLYRFSREVEHSDENLKRLEKMMGFLWLKR
ncbi:MAG: flagellin lysine-N-methylase [Lachnospiraceae bacterium]|nr:flagellin lysine-N-methylase [Lachnospiraceae bacterium]